MQFEQESRQGRHGEVPQPSYKMPQDEVHQRHGSGVRNGRPDVYEPVCAQHGDVSEGRATGAPRQLHRTQGTGMPHALRRR